MLIVRATKKLRDRIGPLDLRGDERSTTVLGEWYATRFGWRADVLLLVNEATLLPVLLPLAPAATALSRAADQIAAAMATYGASDAIIDAELEQMRPHRIGTTANRSVVGIMNEFGYLADVYRGRSGQPNLDELAARLATAPCSPLYRTHISPDRAFTALVRTIPRRGGAPTA
ncbi:hypothetical protein Dvina_47350 [Dactylosporangium vinaceum]|uniref:DUF6933 domain-containing protein n=1 Tax=Dactylosporangium vinaceum TaxID=53362 RepID=A0ABV5M5G5_9ACTN|nr:hypothetical protein [Dactylosporangium vinaceum]UAB95546.1 hypothetical protein Dvina_47350 [Dactylosporangium vinaceum]